MIDAGKMLESVERLERVFGGETRATQSIGEVMELLVRLRQAEKDAARYRWLRDCKWNLSVACVVVDPRKSVKLGCDCPSGDRLDELVDAHL